MNEDFHKRLARLEAKNGGASQLYEPPLTPLTTEPDFGRGGGDGRKPSMFKMLLIGLGCLVILPASAAIGTIYLPQIIQGTD